MAIAPKPAARAAYDDPPKGSANPVPAEKANEMKVSVAAKGPAAPAIDAVTAEFSASAEL
ncbi:hypothetical protein [Bradyrhizobium sp.]|jgi:hypothetical protein|uniref:hypothetical protein n=1 Tax=Bradyrhizobium sp. TaxID=376 RepID=UPI003C23C2D9